MIDTKSKYEMLNDSIAALREKRQQDLVLLKAQINNVTEDLKPKNILKAIRTDAFNFVEGQANIFNRMVTISTKKIAEKITIRIQNSKISHFWKKWFNK